MKSEARTTRSIHVALLLLTASERLVHSSKREESSIYHLEIGLPSHSALLRSLKIMLAFPVDANFQWSCHIFLRLQLQTLFNEISLVRPSKILYEPAPCP